MLNCMWGGWEIFRPAGARYVNQSEIMTVPRIRYGKRQGGVTARSGDVS